MNSHEPLPAQPPVIAGQTAAMETVRIGDHALRFYRLPDLNRLLDEIDPAEFENDERMPYWAELWPSGIVLATVLSGRGNVCGARVLELGCGLGIPSVVAAQMGGYVTATDYFPEALDLLQVNAALNGVQVETRHVDWRDPPDIGPFDLVVAADVLYEPWQPRCVVDVLGRTVAPTGRAIVVDPDRMAARPFAGEATLRGFRVGKTRVQNQGGPAPMIVYDLARA